ncbi:MAG TPA: hypothetical protein VIX17_14170 [Pyrinomonadaceae bacterium]
MARVLSTNIRPLDKVLESKLKEDVSVSLFATASAKTQLEIHP